MKVSFSTFKANMAEFKVIDTKHFREGVITINYPMDIVIIHFNQPISADTKKACADVDFKQIDKHRWVAAISADTEEHLRVIKNKYLFGLDMVAARVND